MSLCPGLSFRILHSTLSISSRVLRLSPLLAQHDCADDGNHQQDRNHLKGEEILAEEDLAHGLHIRTHLVRRVGTHLPGQRCEGNGVDDSQEKEKSQNASDHLRIEELQTRSEFLFQIKEHEDK